MICRANLVLKHTKGLGLVLLMLSCAGCWDKVSDLSVRQSRRSILSEVTPLQNKPLSADARRRAPLRRKVSRLSPHTHLDNPLQEKLNLVYHASDYEDYSIVKQDDDEQGGLFDFAPARRTGTLKIKLKIDPEKP